MRPSPLSTNWLPSFLIGLLALGAGANPPEALAYWPGGGRLVSSAPYSNAPEAIVVDGHGGIIVAWGHYLSTTPSPYELRVQRVDASGIPRWGSPSSGLGVGVPDLWGTRLLEDGSGGAYLAWSTYHLFLLRLGPDGLPRTGWPTGGIQLGTASSQQSYFDIASDGEGGIYVVWEEWAFFGGGAADELRLTRLTGLGVPAPGWSLTGTTICGAPGSQDQVSMIPDGTGGVVICWRDARDEPFTGTRQDGDIYVTRIKQDGSPQTGWPIDGVGVGVASYKQDFPVLIPDGTAGAIICWRDSRADSTGNLPDVYAARIDGEGVKRWGGSGGVPVVATTDWQNNPIAVSDSSGGAYIIWPDARGQIFATHLGSDGAPVPGWQQGGNRVETSFATPFQFVAGSDGAGGLYICWDGFDWNTQGYGIWLLRLQGTGLPAKGWPASGTVVSKGTDIRGVVQGQIGSHGGTLAADSRGGVFVSWYQGVPGIDFSAYVQRVSADGSVTRVPLVGAVSILGNPTRRTATIRVRLPRTGQADIELYDIQGRLRRRAVVAGPSGEEVYATMGLEGLSNGVYLVRSIGSDGTKGGPVKITIVR